MIVSLRELLKAEIFLGSKVIAGVNNIDNIVTSFNILDGYGGYSYADENMLILTSGYFLSKSIDVQMDALEQLAEKGIAAVAFKEKYFNGTIPNQLIEKSNELHLPLVSLSNDSSYYKDFFSFFNNNIYCKGLNKIVSKKAVAEQFIKTMHNDGITGLAEMLYQYSAKKVSISFEKEQYNYPLTHWESEFCKQLSNASNDHLIKSSRRFKGLKECSCHDEEKSKNTYALGINIEFESQCVGHIWLFGDTEKGNENDEEFLHSAKLACELAANQIIVFQQKIKKLRSSFIHQLLTNGLKWKDAISYSHQLNWRLPAHAVIGVVYCLDHPELAAEMESIIYDHQKLNGKTIITHLYDKRIIMITTKTDELYNYYNAFGKYLNNYFSNNNICIGIGRELPLQCAHLSYQQALYAIDIGNKVKHDSTVIDFKKLGIYRIYCKHALPDELKYFCEDYIKPLIDSDLNESLELVKTLKAFFDNQHNYSNTGKHLFLHPNTIRYRIGIIENICNVNLGNSDDYQIMQMALKLMDIVDIN